MMMLASDAHICSWACSFNSWDWLALSRRSELSFAPCPAHMLRRGHIRPGLERLPALPDLSGGAALAPR